MSPTTTEKPPIGRIIFLGVIALGVIFGAVAIAKTFEYLSASEIMVIQAPFSGKLTVYTQPGVYGRWWGTAMHYPKRSQVWFSSRKDQGNKADESLPIRFNDNGKALMSVGISWSMPLDTEHVLRLHTQYGSPEAIEKQLVEPVIQKAVYAVGPLMSSQESASSRRNDLFQFLEDQIQNGVYRTETIQERQKDAMTGADKTVSVVHIIMANGLPVRSDDSPLKLFGVQTFNPVINEINYDKVIEAQIQEQQKAIMSVQTAIAEAKQAEQKAITVAKNGEASAAAAKWEQEVLKAKAVTLAQQELEVNTLKAKAAEQYKIAQTLEGQGEGAKRAAVMAADGALDKKLAAYVQTQELWAKAFENFKGQLVPTIQGSMGGGASNNAALSFMEIMGAKAAKDLAVDINSRPQK